MTYTEIQSALELHQKAFAFLLEARASGRAGSHVLDETVVAAWQRPALCEDWVTRHYEQLPAAHRPEREEIGVFSQFLSSFFTTSFAASRVRRDGEMRFMIRALPTRRLDGSRKSAHAKEKERQGADLLRELEFASLGEECQVAVSPEQFAQLQDNAELTDDLTLWTYAQQLVNRSQYASQGQAVYRLWLELPEKTRQKLSADLIWKARERLIQFLQLPRTT